MADEAMATSTYNACDGISEEAAQAMERAGQNVVSGLIAWLQDLGKNSGGGYLGLGPPISQLEARLQEIVHHVVDDFRHEMVGVMRLKKDPLVNVVSNITNSPGAAQQTVVGDHNQQSLQQQNSHLIKVINDLLASDEFKSLSEPNRFAVQDATDLLRDEIAKPNPDQSKIRRWAGHLLGFAKEFGMHLAATALTKLLMT
jgi:hypothetical protein